MSSRKNLNKDLGRAIARRKTKEKLAAKGAVNTAAAANAAATGRHAGGYDDRPKLQSVLDATDLEELMLNAAMANEDFAAERYGGPLAPQTVVVTPAAPSNKQGRAAELARRRELDKTALRIPRRPKWDEHTLPAQLVARETEEFLVWRRRIAQVEEENNLASTIGGAMMTPFEKNLEVWRQLWRVVERSDVVIQIVDARNPLLYYCEDLFRYVTVEMGRGHKLLLNKADLLSSEMITKWQRYFDSQNIDVIFFSAFKASVNETADDERVVGARELISRLERFPRTAPQTRENQRIVVGACGFPNVGKSSTINVLLETVAADAAAAEAEAAMAAEAAEAEAVAKAKAADTPAAAQASTNGEVHLRAEAGSITEGSPNANERVREAAASTVDIKHIKRAAVSSTPGKTKHFQTLVLTDTVLLCDCPGLVFPNFSASKSELIVAGVLSIDTMRGDALTPVSLIARRIPAAIFEGVYGIRFPPQVQGVLEDVDEYTRAEPGYVSGTVLMDTHARARGFMTDHDRADQSRSARLLLKHYVSGQINFTHAPPPADADAGEAGIGPDVHAKKGKLVYARREAAAEGSALPGPRINGGRDSMGAASGDLFEDGSSQGKVSARAGRGKKNVHKPFTRVERNYYQFLTQ